jgi:hypothetical protein
MAVASLEKSILATAFLFKSTLTTFRADRPAINLLIADRAKGKLLFV